MLTGIDLATDSGRFIDEIKNAGVTFVCRYYRRPTSHYPALTASEARLLSAAGLDVVSIWESASDRPDYFSHLAGVDDSTSAFRQARLAGQPPESTIYFAVDYDAPSSDVTGCISQYFQGIAQGFHAASAGGPTYRVGVYGSGRVCRALLSTQSAINTWLAASRNWAEAAYQDWNIKQGPSIQLSFAHDSDLSQGDCGSFRVA